jgi:hypothetical protein
LAGELIPGLLGKLPIVKLNTKIIKADISKVRFLKTPPTDTCSQGTNNLLLLLGPQNKHQCHYYEVFS